MPGDGRPERPATSTTSPCRAIRGRICGARRCFALRHRPGAALVRDRAATSEGQRASRTVAGSARPRPRGHARRSSTGSSIIPRTWRAPSSSRRSRRRPSARSTGSATSSARRGRSARARRSTSSSHVLSALARDAVPGDHAVPRLPKLRRRVQGHGPRAVRRAATSSREIRSCVRLPPRRPVRAGSRRTSRTGPRACRMTWDDGEPTIGRVFTREARSAARTGAPRATSRSTPRHEAIAASLQAVFEEAAFHVLNALHARHEAAAALPRRRLRDEQRRQRQDPRADAVHATSTSSRRPATTAPRSAPRSTSGIRCSDSRAAS